MLDSVALLNGELPAIGDLLWRNGEIFIRRICIHSIARQS
jgi:hypothetical protein